MSATSGKIRVADGVEETKQTYNLNPPPQELPAFITVKGREIICTGEAGRQWFYAQHKACGFPPLIEMVNSPLHTFIVQGFIFNYLEG